MKVVVSIGGSVLAPDLDAERVADYAGAIQSLDAQGHTLGTVVGGGPTARDYIGTARDLGANEIELDQLGIAVTRLNGRLLIAALDDRAAPTPAESYDEGREAIRRGDIPVLGASSPHRPPTRGGRLRGVRGADLLVYATSVPGVYDATRTKTTTRRGSTNSARANSST